MISGASPIGVSLLDALQIPLLQSLEDCGVVRMIWQEQTGIVMTSPVNHEQAAVAPKNPGPSGFLLRNASDIDFLVLHLLANRKLPRVEFHVERLPALESQRAQHRFTRLAKACNCLLGEILGATTLLVGSFAVWVVSRSWRQVGWVVLAALCVAAIGKGIELAWNRWQLIRVLRGVRRRLAEIASGRYQPVPATAAPVPGRSFHHALNREKGDEARYSRIQRPALPDEPARPLVAVHGAADINRVALRLLTRWTLPRIDIRVATLPPLDVQRAQNRFTRLSESYSYLLAGVLAAVSLLVGLFYVVWKSNETWKWNSGQDWSGVGLVLVVTLYAALLGCALEVLWVRVRLLLVLRGLWRRLR